LKCLNYVASAQWAGVEAFLVAMSFDPIDDIRQLALEGLAFREFQRENNVLVITDRIGKTVCWSNFEIGKIIKGKLN
jgi:hypothetical protein